MKYKPDHRGTRSDVLRDPRVIEHVNDRAKLVKDYVTARAPVKTGAYLDSITMRPRTRMGDRYGAIVTATVPYAQTIERHTHTFAGAVDLAERGG